MPEYVLKGGFFLQLEQVSRHIGFVLQGVCHYFESGDGERLTYYFPAWVGEDYLVEKLPQGVTGKVNTVAVIRNKSLINRLLLALREDKTALSPVVRTSPKP